MNLTPVESCLLVVLGVAAAADLRTGRIYNVLTYPAIAGGLGAALWSVGPGPASAIAGCLFGGGALYVMFAFGWMGGGDVKLMAAVGAFTGFPFIVSAMFYSVLLGGVFAALVLIWRGEILAVAGDLARLVGRGSRRSAAVNAALQPRGGTFPFGVAIAFGTLVAFALRRPI